MGALVDDLRYALRLFGKAPGFTLTAVLILGLGIGLNTAVFSVLDAMLLRPLPGANPERVVMLDSYHSSGSNSGAGLADYVEWREQAKSFDEIAIMAGGTFMLGQGTGNPEKVAGGIVTAGFFDVIGVRPVVGRLFLPGDDQTGRSPVAVLSYAAWQRRFGGSPDVVRESLRLNARTYAIVGVLPPSFRFPGQADAQVWVPLTHSAGSVRRVSQHQYSIIARIKSGTTVQQAQAEMDVIAKNLERQYPAVCKGWRVRVEPLHEALIKNARQSLRILAVTVSLVLVLACANIGSLLLARGAARVRELAVRSALGASRVRIFRQVLTESLVLAVLGGVAGAFLASWGVELMRAITPPEFGIHLETDRRMLAFALAAAVGAGVLFGTLPAFQAARSGATERLRGGPNSGGGRARHRMLNSFVVAEVALALTLLVASGFLVRGFVQLIRTDLGFRTDHVLAFDLYLPWGKYEDRAKIPALASAFFERLQSIPGIECAAASNTVPLGGAFEGGFFTIEGRPAPEDMQQMSAGYHIVTPDYFRTLGIRVLRGRTFNRDDRQGAVPVIVIADKMARKYWPGQDPIGAQVRMRGDEPRTIIGIVADVAHNGAASGRPVELYLPNAQYDQGWPNTAFVVRAPGDPVALIESIRVAARAVDPDMAPTSIRTMEQAAAESLAGQRYITSALASFACFALLLAAIGLYGLMAYTVNQRTREIGMRMALGAARSGVVRLVLIRAVRLAGTGTLLGLAGAAAASRLISPILDRPIGTQDTGVFAGTALFLLAVALLAAWVPARRAARIDPVVALRTE